MKAFDGLIGEQLSSVVFVQDYLQLDYDGQRMTFYEWPILKSGTVEMRFPHQDYRNVLCEFIATLVAKINYVEDVLFEVVFEDGCSFRLDILNAQGEVLYFDNGNGGLVSL